MVKDIIVQVAEANVNTRIGDHQTEEEIRNAMSVRIVDDLFTKGKMVVVTLQFGASEAVSGQQIADADLDLIAMLIDSLKEKILVNIRTREHEMKTRPMKDLLEFMGDKRFLQPKTEDD